MFASRQLAAPCQCETAAILHKPHKGRPYDGRVPVVGCDRLQGYRLLHLSQDLFQPFRLCDVSQRDDPVELYVFSKEALQLVLVCAPLLLPLLLLLVCAQSPKAVGALLPWALLACGAVGGNDSINEQVAVVRQLVIGLVLGKGLKRLLPLPLAKAARVSHANHPLVLVGLHNFGQDCPYSKAEACHLHIQPQDPVVGVNEHRSVAMIVSAVNQPRQGNAPGNQGDSHLHEYVLGRIHILDSTLHKGHLSDPAMEGHWEELGCGSEQVCISGGVRSGGIVSERVWLASLEVVTPRTATPGHFSLIATVVAGAAHLVLGFFQRLVLVSSAASG